MKRITALAYAIILILSLLSCTNNITKDKFEETAKDETKAPKTRISVGLITYKNTERMIYWEGTPEAESYHIKITKHETNQQGNLLYQEGTYEFVDDRRYIKNNYYDISSLEKGTYSIVIYPEADIEIYDCYGTTKIIEIN